MRDVYIAGVNMMRFGKFPQKGIKDLVAEVAPGVLKDAGVEKGDLQAAWFSNSAWGMRSGQDCIRGQVALRPLGIEEIPIMNVENACAGASSALYGAVLGIGSGMYDLVLCVGAEKMFIEDKLLLFTGFLSGMDVDALGDMLSSIEEADEFLAQPPAGEEAAKPRKRSAGKRSASALKKAKDLPGKAGELATLVKDIIVLRERYGHALSGKGMGKKLLKTLFQMGGGGGRSPFMDAYSFAARWHMKKFGSTQRQLAVISAKNHYHSSLNPLAQLQRSFTAEEVLAARQISWPLTLPMCAPIGDGATAAVLCSAKYLKKLKDARPVKIRACVLGSGTNRDMEGPDIGFRVAKLAYEKAGLGPEDVNVAEVHDATAYGELHQCECLGFCPEGEGGILAESGATKLGGRVPVNTSGGLESRGHPIGASGMAQIYEMVTQLRGEAGKRQVENARIALCENGGGNIGYEEAAMVITILEKIS